MNLHNHCVWMLVGQVVLFMLFNNVAIAVAACAPSCTFDMDPTKEATCKVYGSVGNVSLVPWNRANRTCLDIVGINYQAIDDKVIWNMCPFANTTNANSDSITKYLRNPGNYTMPADTVMSWYPNIFSSLDNKTNFTLNNEISNPQGSKVNCALVPTLCWATILTLFSTDDVKNRICIKFHQLQMDGLIREQQMIRSNLCTGGSPTSSNPQCEPLVSQINEYKMKFPSVNCDQYTKYIATKDVPPCPSGTTSKTSNAPNHSYRNIHAKTIAMRWSMMMGWGLFISLLL